MKYLSLLINNKRLLFFILLLIFALYSSFLIIQYGSKFNSDNSLSLLSGQFLKGHISLEYTKTMPLGDISKFNGKFYLFYAPLPSLILMPFVAFFGKNFPQIALGIFSMLISFAATFSLSRYFKFSKDDSLWLSLFFVFSTVLFSSSLINISAYQVEALGVPFVLLSLREYFVKKKPVLAGVFLGLAVITRPNLIIAVVFFILEFLQKRLELKKLILIFVPVLIFSLFFGAYNYLRFHSFLDTGYTHSITLDAFPLSHNLMYGYMSLNHIPANIYSFLIKPPDPLTVDSSGFVLKFPYLKVNPWGMAIWFTSPLFLTLLFKFRKNKYSLSAIITAILLAIPILIYYSVGFAQYGYRYALDFLPFLFLILIPCLLPKLSKKELLLISIGVIFNSIYITSLWGIYPLFGIF